MAVLDCDMIFNDDSDNCLETFSIHFFSCFYGGWHKIVVFM